MSHRYLFTHGIPAVFPLDYEDVKVTRAPENVELTRLGSVVLAAGDVIEVDEPLLHAYLEEIEESAAEQKARLKAEADALAEAAKSAPASAITVDAPEPAEPAKAAEQPGEPAKGPDSGEPSPQTPAEPPVEGADESDSAQSGGSSTEKREG